MACITVFAPTMAMATTQLARVVRYEEFASWPMEGNSGRVPLRMSWVVVTEENGNRKLSIQWTPAV